MASLLLSGSASASGVVTPVGDPGSTPGDLFDYSKINVVSNSATYNSGSDIRDIFGGSFSSLEGPGHTIFSDTPGQLTTYQITFTTQTPVSLSSYALYLGEDGTSLNRSATNFTLKADGNVISNVNLAAVGQSYSSAFGGWGAIQVADNFSSAVTASTFQLLFTSNVGYNNGIRVYEFDGQGASGQVIGNANNPEPSSILMMLGGLLFVAVVRHRVHVRSSFVGSHWPS